MNADTLIAIVGMLFMVSLGTWSALKGRFFARKPAIGLPRHRIPDVTQEDVERIVRRDFPAEQFPDNCDSWRDRQSMGKHADSCPNCGAQVS
jgi:hypothetical protein